MEKRYTAKHFFNNNKYILSQANNLDKLITHTILLLDTDLSYRSGTIVDNNSGKIVHRCQKIGGYR